MQDLVKQLNVEDMIYEIRGKQVMLDSDLAKLYGVETKRINEAVKNNPEKFPERFSWVLDITEINSLRSKFSTLKRGRGQHSKYSSRVFTEQGIAMLATILRSPVAIETSIKIMDAFVAMRKYIATNLIEQKYINNLVLEHDSEIKMLQESFDKLSEKTKVNSLFFDGQIYDAYSLLIDILSNAKNEIIIIDNYAGKELLDILKDIKTKIIIISSNIDETLKKKYESQYHNIEFINNNLFHDRFIIVDKSTLYHCGASFKDLGHKCFAINKIEDKEVLSNLLKYLK
jgi:hypothetical protein